MQPCQGGGEFQSFIKTGITIFNSFGMKFVIHYRQHVRDHTDQWQRYYNEKAPQTADLPAPWKENLNDFQQMIVLRCIRPDKVFLIVQNIFRFLFSQNIFLFSSLIRWYMARDGIWLAMPKAQVQTS